MREPSEIVDVSCSVDELDEAMAFDRRKFMKEFGVAVLTVQCLPLIAHAAAHSPGDGNQTVDSLIIRSGPGLISHVHDLLIPYSVLKVPPANGVAFQTTQALLHRHRVALTRDQLIAVSQGATVTKKASSHVFTIAWAKP